MSEKKKYPLLKGLLFVVVAVLIVIFNSVFSAGKNTASSHYSGVMNEMSAEFESSTAAKDSEIGSLNLKLSEINAENNDLFKQLAEDKNERTKLVNKLNAIVKEKDDLERQNNELKEELIRTKNELYDAKDEIERLKNRGLWSRVRNKD